MKQNHVLSAIEQAALQDKVVMLRMLLCETESELHRLTIQYRVALIVWFISSALLLIWTIYR